MSLFTSSVGTCTLEMLIPMCLTNMAGNYMRMTYCLGLAHLTNNNSRGSWRRALTYFTGRVANSGLSFTRNSLMAVMYKACLSSQVAFLLISRPAIRKRCSWLETGISLQGLITNYQIRNRSIGHSLLG